MEYKAQLVIRSRDREGVELIEEIKALATEQEKTFSETALEVLALGLHVAKNQPQAPEDAPAEDAVAPAEVPNLTAEPSNPPPTQEPEPAAESTGKSSPAPPPETPARKRGTDSLPAVEVAQRCAQQIKAGEPLLAAQILAEFFAQADPIQGGRIKSLLQEDLPEDDYETLIENLRRTQEYRRYCHRVIYER